MPASQTSSGGIGGHGDFKFTNHDIEVATRQMLSLVAQLRTGSDVEQQGQRLVKAGANLRKRNKAFIDAAAARKKAAEIAALQASSHHVSSAALQHGAKARAAKSPKAAAARPTRPVFNPADSWTARRETFMMDAPSGYAPAPAAAETQRPLTAPPAHSRPGTESSRRAFDHMHSLGIGECMPESTHHLYPHIETASAGPATLAAAASESALATPQGSAAEPATLWRELIEKESEIVERPAPLSGAAGASLRPSTSGGSLLMGLSRRPPTQDADGKARSMLCHEVKLWFRSVEAWKVTARNQEQMDLGALRDQTVAPLSIDATRRAVAFNTTALRNPMTGMASAAIAFTTAECRARNQRARASAIAKASHDRVAAKEAARIAALPKKSKTEMQSGSVGAFASAEHMQNEPEEEAHLREQRRYTKIFHALDEDGSGMIDACELVTAWRKLGRKVTLKVAEAMVAETDLDGNGTIDETEFLGLCEKYMNYSYESGSVFVDCHPPVERWKWFSAHELQPKRMAVQRRKAKAEIERHRLAAKEQWARSCRDAGDVNVAFAALLEEWDERDRQIREAADRALQAEAEAAAASAGGSPMSKR